ncbi:MAG TPA: glutamate 5-kinase, partial [Brevibacterium ravenspurgense]|nr:glutamate 5-kinase [Brevibacterium ravenspurgense]
MTDAAAVRDSIRRAETIVVKVGSSSITDEGGLNRARLVELTDIIGKLHDAGKRVILVTSGAVATGLGPMPIEQRPSDLPTLQAAAAVGQSLLMTAYTEELASHGVVTAQVLLTVDDMVRRSTYR